MDHSFKLFLATALFLAIGSIVTTIITIKDIVRFRTQLEPGDCAKVKTESGMIRAKLLARNIGENYLFESMDTKDLILTIPANIYRP